MLGQWWLQAGEQSLEVNWESSKASEESPTVFLSTPQASTHSSVSMCSFMFATTTSDVLHWYSTFPSFPVKFSNKHLFPDDAIANPHTLVGKFSQMKLPEDQYSLYTSTNQRTKNLLFCDTFTLYIGFVKFMYCGNCRSQKF